MQLLVGNLYCVKNTFFEYINDAGLMKNHGTKSNRPVYLSLKEKEIIWLIPLSSKVDKYKRIYISKLLKHGKCDTIYFAKIMGNEHAVLLQNIFPCREEYIDHEYRLKSGKNIHIPKYIKMDIIKRFNILFKLKENGINLFY